MQGLEPLFQMLRISQVWPHLQRGVLIDFGCDHELSLVKKVSPYMKKVIGIDIVSRPHRFDNVEIIKADLEKKLPLPAGKADTITMLAVLEHLAKPAVAVKEAYRLLKPGGVFLVTVPSPQSAPILPWLAKIGIVRQEMVDQHHNYFTHEALTTLAEQAGFSEIVVESWEVGFNTFMKAVK